MIPYININANAIIPKTEMDLGISSDLYSKTVNITISNPKNNIGIELITLCWFIINPAISFISLP